MKGSEFILTSPPRGVFEECTVSGTPYPGTCMEIVPSTAPANGRFTYRAVTRANGAKGPVVVLGPDRLQGGLMTTIYVTATRGFLYWPVAGEELNMYLRDSAGTGTAGEENIGDLLAIEKDSGLLMAGGSLASTPFWLMEHRGVATGDVHVWVKYLGNNA